MSFVFNLIKKDMQTEARLGEFQTAHGRVATPVFMPVGTLATVKTVDPRELLAMGAEIILGNTYHLLLRPGQEVFEKFNGIHRFMKWPKPVLTDSGGFQIFSLARARKVTEEGAVFQSYIEGDYYKLSPESSIAMQNAIGSDIMMVLDQCLPSTAPYEETRLAMELTHRWASRSYKAHLDRLKTVEPEKGQALFGIVQGGVFPELRRQSVDFLTQIPFDGFAIGGLAVGETKSEREDHTEIVTSILPQNRPRYLMGVGTPIDLLEAVRRGVDMFDCIIPTKMAQQGNVYTAEGELKLAQAKYKLSDDVLDSVCSCTTCATFSRGYLHHLTKCRESLGWRLLAIHNIHFYLTLMRKTREAIARDSFWDFYKTCLSCWQKNPPDDLLIEASREPSTFRPPRRPPKGELVESSKKI